jgi:hypothetical protein
MTVEDLFRSYWWLLFPLAFFVAGGFDQWMRYRRHRDTLDLIKTYASQGKEPPAALLDQVKKLEDDDEDIDDRRDRRYRRRYRYGRSWRGEGTWYHVVLFAVISAGFAYAAFTNLYGQGHAFVIVAFVTGALSLASLVALLTKPRTD